MNPPMRGQPGPHILARVLNEHMVPAIDKYTVSKLYSLLARSMLPTAHHPLRAKLR